MNKRFPFLIFVILFVAFNQFAQTAQIKSFDSNYKRIFNNPTQDKNFYLLSLLQNQNNLRKLLNKNKTQILLSNRHLESLKSAANCTDVKCYDNIFRFSNDEISTISKVLESLKNDKSLIKLVQNHLRPSGMFIRYEQKTDSEMLVLAWQDAAKGVNHILDVFGLGKDSAYKDIDNVSYDVNSDEYRQILKAKVGEINLKTETLFFEPTLAYAMKLLEANKRDEAGRHELLEAKDNKKAFENLKKIKWNDYPYSVILVLGSGPGNTGLSISKEGMTRSDEAVKLFQAKQAPLLILSGGYVHPAHTPFCEAIEMKKYIMEKYGIAERYIFIEPHARHTTTNVRNAARIMFRDGFPTEKKGLITSSQSHIDYVFGETFKKRFMDEIGFVPMQIFQRISPLAVEFIPLKDALFINSMETLDP